MRKPRTPNREDRVEVRRSSAKEARSAPPPKPAEECVRVAAETMTPRETRPAPADVTVTAERLTAVAETTREKAMKLVNRYVWLTSGVGLVPVPAADVVAGTALQMNLIDELAALYERHPDKSWGKRLCVLFTPSLGVAAAGQFLMGSLSKALPGVGTLIGMATMPVFFGASTYAIGTLLVDHFERGGELDDFWKRPSLKREAAERFEDGKRAAREAMRERGAGEGRA